MAQPLQVLFIAAEVAPFSKTGGLADVTGSLPKALASLGHDVRVVTPAHRSIEAAARIGRWGTRWLDMRLRVPVGGGLVEAGVLEATLPGSAVPVWFVAERQLFDRPRVYGDQDDAWRYAFFSRAALDLAVAAMGWRPDVVHVHDWHTAPAVAWLATAGRLDPRYRDLPTVQTIHNLMHQGYAPREVLGYAGIDAPPLLEEPPGETNLLARGIYHATMVNTVSPTYAREILTPEGGSGLDGLLRYRHFDVHGILNGIDTDVWDPATDRGLAATFSSGTLEARLANKRALQARLGLPEREDLPLVGMITRLDRQKGLDLVGHVVHLLMNNVAGGEAQFVLLGSGAEEYEQMLSGLASYHRQKMAVFVGYSSDLPALIYGGSDLFLMPSLFEPCGLGQLIAMRYGSVPVVRATGGLVDTVRDGVTGFAFSEFSSEACWNALARAVHVWRTDRDGWRALQAHGMGQDFSWHTSARSYAHLYGWAVARVQGA